MKEQDAMTTDYELSCHGCKVSLGIGQASVGGRFYVYTAPEYAAKLAEFLLEHEGHPLEFGDMQKTAHVYSFWESRDDGTWELIKIES